MDTASRSRIRSVLTAAGIAIASGALVSMVAFALGLQRQIEAPFKQLGLLNNIQVRPSNPDDEGEAENEGESPSAADLQAFVKERLAPHKYPRFIEFVDELPKTATGKIQRFRLREREGE